MSLDVFNVVVRGYTDRLLDQQILAVQTGYWAAYYVGTKHPKSTKDIAEKMLREHQKAVETKASAPKPEVDVEAFLDREAKFTAKLQNKGR